MAKKSNQVDLTAGLSFGDSQKVEQTAPMVNQEPAQEKEPVVQEAAPVVEPVAEASEPAKPETAETAQEVKSLVEVYASELMETKEPRSVRIQAVVTPSIGKKLDALVAQGKIRSKNDLINFLLKEYLSKVE